MVEAKLLRKKLKNGLIVDKWDLVNIIEKQQAEIERLTTKNLEWLANWNEQQAEIEALKAHPAKELTNDEMRKVINEIVDGVTVSEMVTFLAISRAILRKAQEK